MLMEGFVLKPFPYGDTEKTGFVHQLHAGATWMKHPLEDVSQRCDRTPVSYTHLTLPTTPYV